MVSLTIFLFMLGAMLFFGVALTWAIAGNMRRGDEVRRKLARRLNKLRLGRSLNLFGIDPDAYLRTQSIVDIDMQMRNCHSCTELERCDSSLAKGAVEDFDFCPNHGSLLTLRDAAQLAQQQ